MNDKKPESKLREALMSMDVKTAPPVQGPAMQGLSSFNSIPVVMPVIYPYTGITRKPSTDIHIPGVPRLYSRGKDSALFNPLIDHFGVVFTTGANGEPRPNDLVFDLQVWTGHRLIRYQQFCNGEVPTPYNIEIDSKARIINRLNDFYERPRRWRLWFNCEHFARWIMSGKEESKQNDKAIEVTMVVLETMATALAKMAEAQRKFDEERLKRLSETDQQQKVQQTAALPMPPAPAVTLATQNPVPVAKPPTVATASHAPKKKRRKSGAKGKKPSTRKRPKGASSNR